VVVASDVVYCELLVLGVPVVHVQFCNDEPEHAVQLVEVIIVYIIIYY
jgi:hypothetical protein